MQKKNIFVAIVIGIMIALTIHTVINNGYEERAFENTESMTDEEALEYVLSLDAESYDVYLNRTTAEEGERITKLYYAYQISKASAEDAFVE